MAASALKLDELLEFKPSSRVLFKALHSKLAHSKSAVWRAQRALETVSNGLGQACMGLKQLQDIINTHACDQELTKQPAKNEPVVQAIDAVEDIHDHLQLLSQTLIATVARDLEQIQTRMHQEAIDLYQECKRLEKEFCKDLQRYGKFSQKKDTEKARFDLNMSIRGRRQEMHHAQLDYAVAANTHLHTLDTIFHRPLAQLIQLLSQHFHAGLQGQSNSDQRADLRDLLHKLNEQGLDEAIMAEKLRKTLTDQSMELKDTLDHQYMLDVDENDPFVDAELVDPASTDEHRKEGYLFWRQRKRVKVGPVKWELVYAICQHGQIELLEGETGKVLLTQSLLKARPSFEDTDDRRFVFHIVSPKLKRPLMLQASNTKQLRHWITVIGAQARQAQHEQGTVAGSAATAIRYQPDLHLDDSDDDLEPASSDVDQGAQWSVTDNGDIQLSLSTPMLKPAVDNEEDDSDDLNASNIGAELSGLGLDDDFDPDAALLPSERLASPPRSNPF